MKTDLNFNDIAREIKKLPDQIAAAVKKDQEQALNGNSARSALRMAIGKPTVTSIDEHVAGALK